MTLNSATSTSSSIILPLLSWKLLSRGFLCLRSPRVRVYSVASHPIVLTQPPTAHWNQFFKENPNKGPGQDQEYVFDWEHLKRVHKSYIDSIVVEIGLPGSPIPKGVLLHILRDAVDETPKDAKLFPQLLWDALGDLSVSLSRALYSSGTRCSGPVILNVIRRSQCSCLIYSSRRFWMRRGKPGRRIPPRCLTTMKLG